MHSITVMDAILSANFHIATVNYAVITNRTNENHLLGNNKPKLFQIIHSLTIPISATDQWRHATDSQYINFLI
jgi:hypothetical protein